MAYLTIPWQDSPEFAQQIQLEGRTYRMRARWNTHGQAWDMDLLTAQREPIVTGIRLVGGAGLLSPFRDDRLPPGEFLVIGDPTRADVRLLYRESNTE